MSMSDNVLLRLSGLEKSFDGNIVSYNEDDGSVTLDVNGSEVVIGAKEYSNIKTVCEF